MKKVIMLLLIFALFAYALSASDPNTCLKKGSKCVSVGKSCCKPAICNIYANRCIGW
nr:venom polypeptide precursor [Doratifera vulnerans]